MAEIFISYSRDDRDIAHGLAVALEAAGIGVWWDRELTGGGDFAAEIERHLTAAPLVVVLWSSTSVLSDFVRDESGRARDLRKLLPIRIEPVALPLGFGTLHTLDLIDWDGDPDDDALTEILSQIRHRLAQAAKAGSPTAPPLERLRRSFSKADPLTRLRIKRRWLIGLGIAGVAGAGGIGWSLIADKRKQREREQLLERQRAALAHLEKAFDHHFETNPPDLKKAELEYRQATEADSTLAEAFFYWAHLTVAQMERNQPKPSRAELAGLRADAQERFRQSMALSSLDRGKRAVAQEQISLLATTEPAPLERSTDDQLVAALATTVQPAAELSPAAAEPARPTPGPSPSAHSTRPHSQAPASGIGAAAGSIIGSIGGLLGGKPTAQGSQTPRPPARPPAQIKPEPAKARPAPRVAASDVLVSQAEAQAKALFSPDRDGRVAAQSVLAGNPELAAEALPAALQAALDGLTEPNDTANRAGMSSTLQLIGSATPAVLGANRKAIESFLKRLVALPERAPAGSQAVLAQALKRSEGIRATVFVQIAHERQTALARQLVKEFEVAGYAIADIEITGEQRAPSRPEVRSHGGSDPAIARWCQSRLSKLIGADVVLKNLRDIRPNNDVFEIWFDAALCAPGGREVAGCGKD